MGWVEWIIAIEIIILIVWFLIKEHAKPYRVSPFRLKYGENIESILGITFALGWLLIIGAVFISLFIYEIYPILKSIFKFFKNHLLITIPTITIITLWLSGALDKVLDYFNK